MINQPAIKNYYATDKAAKVFLALALSYLLFGLTLGVIGGFQYILPDFLKNKLSLSANKTPACLSRHYLVIYGSAGRNLLLPATGFQPAGLLAARNPNPFLFTVNCFHFHYHRFFPRLFWRKRIFGIPSIAWRFHHVIMDTLYH